MRYLSKFLTVLFAIFFTLNSFAQTVRELGADKIKIGTPSSAQNPSIEMDGSFIRKNKSTGKLEFSNDGAVVKNLGSGSGSGDGGTPLNDNSSFEDNVVTGWSYSGSSFTQGSYTNYVENDLKYAIFTASASGQYFESTAKAIPDSTSGGCLAKIEYYSTDASGTWKLQVYDGTSNLLKEQVLDPKNWQSAYASFSCPSAGTLVKLRVISTAAGTIYADRTYVGKENRTFQVSQSKLIGRAVWPLATLCEWNGSTTNTSATTNFSADTDCIDPTLTGTITAPATKIPAVIMAKGNAGLYRVTVSGVFIARGVTTATACNFKISDGTTESGNLWIGDTGSASNLTGSTIVGFFNYGSGVTSKQFEVKYTKNSGGGNCGLSSGTAHALPEMTIEYIPNESQTALVPEAQDWFIDANIGGANTSLGTTAVSSYTELTNASLDMVINSGSASAKIPCSSTNSSSGLTCSAGNESVGVVFTNPQAGYYRACVYGSHYTVIPTATTTSVAASFQLVETASNSTSITQEGKSKAVHIVENLASNINRGEGASISHCGTFYFSSVGERAIRLMYEQSVAGAPTTSMLLMDRDASVGQRDLRITVEPILSASNRPYLVDTNVYGKVNQTSGQSFANSTNTKLIWSSTPNFNRGITWDSANNRFVATQSGIYNVCSKLRTSTVTWSADNGFNSALYKNGTFFEEIDYEKKDTSTVTTAIKLDGCVVLSLASGDYVEVIGNLSRPAGNVTLDNGSGLNTFSINRLGDL